MNDLIKHFPREICFPDRTVVGSKEKMFQIFRKYNRIVNIYFSLYNCDGNGKFSKPMIDKISFDLDSPKSFENIKNAHYKLKKLKRKHLILMSGNGYWIHQFTKNYENLRYPGDALKNAINYSLNELGLSMGEEKIADTDWHCVDIPRISRFPNSYNKKAKRYCIPITEEDLEKGDEYIKQKAMKPVYEFVYYGTELLDMTPFDYEIKKTYIAEMPEHDWNAEDWNKIKEDVIGKVINDFIPCIKRILLEEGIDTYDNRYLFAFYCAEIGLPMRLTDAIAKKYFSKKKRSDGLGTNYDHFVKFKVLEYAYNNSRKENFFPTCDSLFKKGLCLGKCPRYNKAVYRE